MSTTPDRMENAAAETAGVEPGREALKLRIDRFARIRAAHRLLPISASEIDLAEERDRVANDLRATLKGLATPEALSSLSEAELRASLERVDGVLDRMDEGLLERVDRTSIADIRNAATNSAEARRADVLALADALAIDREGLLERLTKLELLVTILATEATEGDRKIVHDPATLSPTLESLFAEQETCEEDELLALELYQAANSEDIHDDVAALRLRRQQKDALGLRRLAPTMLRAVVTYNARVFNRLADHLHSSIEADALLEEMVREPSLESADAVDTPQWGVVDESDEIWERIGAPPQAESVFEASAIDRLIDALARHLRGVPIGSCTSERIVLALDVARLETLEREAFLEKEPSDIQDLLRRTAVVGLLLRDVGVVRSQLPELGIDELVLGRAWLREVEQSLARVISEKIADVEQYAQASALSGIKTKHLLAPLQQLRGERSAADAPGGENAPTVAIAKVPLVQRSADGLPPTPPPTRKKTPVARKPVESDPRSPWLDLFTGRRGVAIAASLVLVPAFVFGWNRLMATPTNAATLDPGRLAQLSPYLVSAYRSGRGEGPMLIGRVDRDFAKLPASRQAAVAEQLGGLAAERGVREVIAYGPSGRLRIHLVDGELRRPRVRSDGGRLGLITGG